MKLHLVGGWRDGEVIDLDEPQWGWACSDIDAGILPPSITIDASPHRLTTYRQVAVDGDEGRYQIDPAGTASRRALIADRARVRRPGTGGGL